MWLAAPLPVEQLVAQVGPGVQQEADRPVARDGPCPFVLTGAQPTLRTAGPSEIVARIRTPGQAESPVQIIGADFTGSSLWLASGSFEWHPRYALEVQNVSDQPVTDVRVRVLLQRTPGSSVGNESKAVGPLVPGGRMTLSGTGSGRGSFPSDDLTVELVVESVRIGSCEYRPSQSTWSERPRHLPLN
jgi:hypothetical protein